MAMHLLQRLQTRQERGSAAGFDMLQRPAAEGGKAGAEDDPGIKAVSTADHPFPPAGHRFVEEAEHEAVADEIGRASCRERV